MIATHLAAILRANAVDADKELPLSECLRKFYLAPKVSQESWIRRAEKYLAETKLNDTSA